MTYSSSHRRDRGAWLPVTRMGWNENVTWSCVSRELRAEDREVSLLSSPQMMKLIPLGPCL